MQCKRCRRQKKVRVETRILPVFRGQYEVDLCDRCLKRFEETIPLIYQEFMRGALYPKGGELFLAQRITRHRILR